MTKQFKRMVLRDIIPLSLSTMPLLAYSFLICIFYTSSSHYNKPPMPSEYQLDQSSEAFYLAVVPLLKSKAVKTSNRCQFSMRHDIYRFPFKNKGTQARDLITYNVDGNMVSSITRNNNYCAIMYIKHTIILYLSINIKVKTIFFLLEIHISQL